MDGNKLENWIQDNTSQIRALHRLQLSPKLIAKILLGSSGLGAVLVALRYLGLV